MGSAGAPGTRSSAARYGIYYDQPLVGIFEQNAFTNPPFVNNVSTDAASLSNPGAGIDADHVAACARSRRTATDFKNPRTMQWNIGVTSGCSTERVAEVELRRRRAATT